MRTAKRVSASEISSQGGTGNLDRCVVVASLRKGKPLELQWTGSGLAVNWHWIGEKREGEGRRGEGRCGFYNNE